MENNKEQILSKWIEKYPDSERYDAALQAMEEYAILYHASINKPKEGEVPQDLNNAWPTHDVLSKLIWASSYLLNEKSYDGSNYEEIQTCINRGKEILESIKIQLKEGKIEGEIKKLAMEILNLVENARLGHPLERIMQLIFENADKIYNLSAIPKVEPVYPNKDVQGVKFEDRK